MDWLIQLPVPLIAFLASLFTYAMTASGSASVFISKKLPSGALAFMTGSAAGIMIAASFFSLILPAIEYIGTSLSTVTFGFFLGGLFIFFTDFIVERSGVNKKKTGSSLFFFAVTVHNIPEGLSVGVALAGAALSGESAFSAALLFVFGIGIQNFPEGVCVSYSLRSGGMGLKRSFFYSQLSGAVEILSAVAGSLLVSSVGYILPFVLSFAAGAMIAVTCSELIPEAFEKYKRLAGVGVIVGFALMMLLDLAL